MSYVILVLGNVGVGKTSLINCVVQTSTTTDDDDVVEQQQEAATITTAVTNNNNHHTTPTKQAPCHEGMDPLSPMSPQSPVSPIMPQRRGIDAHHAVLPGKDGEEDQRYTLVKTFAILILRIPLTIAYA